MIAENVAHIRQRVAAACQRAGRNPEEITLIAVTKTFGAERAQEAVDAGILDLGENYVQELRRKRDALEDRRIRWHFIGHLQTNKIKPIAGWIHMIHAVDSVNLARQVAVWAERNNRTIDILVEVNTSGEPSKFGVSVDAASDVAEGIVRLPNVNLVGLMTIGPFLPEAEASRPAFRTLAELRTSLRNRGVHLRHLSMGMSHDFEVAIEEGATMVRIGTAIFGRRRRAQSGTAEAAQL